MDFSRKNAQRAEEIVSILPTKSPIKPQLELVKQKAIEGDNKAALQLFVDLKNCRDIVKRSEDFVGSQNKSSNKDDPERNELINQLDNCKGIGVEDTQDVMKWLDLAARRGDSQAQIMWIDYFLDEKGGAPWMLQHPEEAQEYKQQALDYLDNLSNKCNQSALTILFWQAYQGGPLVNQDEYKAYKYGYLMNLTYPGSIKNEEMEAISSKLQGDQIRSATSSAERIFDSACKAAA